MQQSILCLDIIGPHLPSQVWNETSGKTTPVTLSEQRSSHHWQMMRNGNNLSRLYSTAQITRHDSVYLLISKTLSHLQGLFPTLFIEFSRGLSLHDLSGIIHRLTMPY
jgi:hypothetical protein